MNKSTRISRSAAGIVTAIVAGLAAVSASAQDACIDERITPSDALAFKVFGSAIDAEGDTLIVGAMHDSELAQHAGAAYVFNRIGGEWVEVQKLFASDGGKGDFFGRNAIAIDGDRVAIDAASHIDRDAPEAGAVYIFENDGSKWVEAAKITPSQGNFQHVFGFSLDLKGDTLVIGAPGDNNENGTSAGAAYVFHYDGTNWVEQQKLVASIGGSGDSFGIALAIADDSILVGSPGFDSDDLENGFNVGALYRFAFDARATEWIEAQMLLASDAFSFKKFGRAVDAFGDIAVVSTSGGQASLSGAYVFALDRTTNEWIEQQKLVPVPSGSVRFGRSSAIDEGVILVSDDERQEQFGLPKGSAHVFQPTEDGEWVQTALLRPEANDWTPFFGLWSIAVSPDYAVIDATGEDAQAGAVYVFDLNPTPGDVNCDGVVNGDDLAHFLGEWGPCDICEHCPADVDGNCTVDGADLAILLGNWG